MNRFSISTIFCAVALIAGGGNVAIAEEPEQEALHIEAQPLSSALREFSEQTGLQIGYAAELASGKETKGVAGVDNPAIALDALLASTGLEHRFVNAETVVIRATETSLAEAEGSSDSGNSLTASSQVLMAQTQTPAPKERNPTKSDDDEEDALQLDKITVTGTYIRGIAPDSSPVRTYTSEDIQNSGAATAQDFIQTLPANFSGGSNPHIVSSLPNDANAGSNSDAGSFGASVNLRGLGSGSTLVLLNGRRVAPSSGIGDFVDISMIPASALERIEVLTDGASSIYGGDAVAGVVNFVLRSDYAGTVASYRYGTVTEGDVDAHRASITSGKAWDTGNALLIYEFFRQTELSAADRSFSQGAVLPTDLLPSQERHSAMASISQELTPQVELFADVLFSKRETVQRRGFTSGGFALNTPESQNLNVSAGGVWEAFDDWFVDFSGTYSRLEQDLVSLGNLNNMTDVGAETWTADVKTSGTVLSIPGGNLKLAIGGHYREEDFSKLFTNNVTLNVTATDGHRDVYAVFGEAFVPLVGSDNAFPGVERFEISASGRFEDYSDFGRTANPKVGVLWSPFEGLNLRASSSTSFKSPPLGRVGGNLTATSFPQALINSIFGFTPPDPSIADVVVLSLSGPAKKLDAEESRALTGGLDFSKSWSRHNLSGSITYFDIDFRGRLGTTPIPEGQSGFAVPNIAFVSPGAFPPGTVIFFPTMDQVNEVLDSADIIFGLFGTDPRDAEVIVTTSVVQNLARTLVSGFDFDVAYNYETDFGDVSFGLDGTFLKEFQRQGAVTTPLVEEVDTLYNPLGLKLRGRAGYSHGGFGANIFVNYMDNYHTDSTSGAAPIDSWTTIDLTLSYDTKEKFHNTFLDNASVRLSVLNLLDKDPPFAGPGIPALGLFSFDPTNASPLNRFIAIELTKRF